MLSETDETCNLYRLAQQMIDIHSQLAERFERKRVGLDLLLIACAVVFCAMTFAAEGIYTFLGIDSSQGPYYLGIASVVAFMSSLSALVFDWRNKQFGHTRAVERWGNVIEEFRKLQCGDGKWRPEDKEALSGLYWRTSDASPKVPGRKFNRCKARYLRKVEISKLLSNSPGCPVAIAWLLVVMKGSYDAIREATPKTK